MFAATQKISLGLACVIVALAIPQSRADTYSFTNAGYITINDSTNPPTLATPYPSAINVTGLTGLVVTNMTVTLNGFTHSFPSDVDILLAGPRGQMAMLMSEVGGQNQFGVTNLTITLDDSEPDPLPVLDPLFSGSFRPTARISPLFFNLPSPAPAGNSNAVTALSAFGNTDPNGTWSLYVVDDSPGDDGYISGGWSMNISVGVPLQVGRSGTNVVFSWPAVTNHTFAVQSLITVLNSNVWSNAPGTAVQVSGRYVLTNAVITSGTNTPRYFRLLGQ